MPPRLHVAKQREQAPRKRYHHRQNRDVHINTPELPLVVFVAVDNISHVFPKHVKRCAKGDCIHETFQRKKRNRRPKQYHHSPRKSRFEDITDGTTDEDNHQIITKRHRHTEQKSRENIVGNLVSLFASFGEAIDGGKHNDRRHTFGHIFDAQIRIKPQHRCQYANCEGGAAVGKPVSNSVTIIYGQHRQQSVREPHYEHLAPSVKKIEKFAQIQNPRVDVEIYYAIAVTDKTVNVVVHYQLLQRQVAAYDVLRRFKIGIMIKTEGNAPSKQHRQQPEKEAHPYTKQQRLLLETISNESTHFLISKSLQLAQFLVRTIFGEKFVVATALDDFAVLEDANLIGIADGREAVGNDD